MSRPMMALIELPASHADKWAGFSKAVPGFGGMYYNQDGDLVVVLKDTLAQKSAASLALASFVGGSHRPSSLGAPNHPSRMLFSAGNFDYQELLTYKETVSAALQRYDADLSSIGIDEMTNSVHVGIVRADRADQIAATALASGIPTSGLRVMPEGRHVPSTSSVYLRSTFTPVAGGIRIWIGGTYCTMGLPVRYLSDSLPGFLTAGHCAANNGDSVGLTDRGGAITMFGTLVDNGHWNYTCSHGTNCRHADVALAKINASVSSYHGGIAQGNSGGAVPPSYWAGTFEDPQAYDPASGYGTANGPFMVADDFTPGNEVVGQWMNKIGMATGWTEGQISIVNTDIQTNVGFWVTGAVTVNAGGYPGDSGSGVYTANTRVGSIDGNPPVTFDGILFAITDTATVGGHPGVGRKFDYAPLYNVRQQLANYIFTHR